MTTIVPVTIQGPSEYRRRGYNLNLIALLSGSVTFNELRELFAKSGSGSKIHDDIPGSRPLGEDLTSENLNTQYCIFTQGTTGKVQDGFYLIRSYSFTDDETPEGHDYVFGMNLFFLGTSAYYQDGYRMKGLDEVTNDWGL